jgi:hypothetical protein
MRILGTIDHPTCRIQAFQYGNKFSVKFELGMYEQTFKFRESAHLKDFADMQKIIDAPFIAQAMTIFRPCCRRMGRNYLMRKINLQNSIFKPSYAKKTLGGRVGCIVACAPNEWLMCTK